MRILLTAPDVLFVNYNRRAPAQALYLLAAVLREAGHVVKVLDHSCHDLILPDGGSLDATRQNIDYSHFLSRDQIAGLDALANKLIYSSLLKEIQDVDCVGISANSLNWVYAIRMIESLREQDSQMPIIIGGPHATFLPDHILKTTSADFVVRGEGELTLPELLSSLEKRGDPNQVLGVSHKKNGKIIHNPDRPPLTAHQLESMPFPAYDLLPDQKFSSIGVETARGCLHSCKFCSIPFRRSWRGLAPQVVLKRIAHAQSFLPKLKKPMNGRCEMIFLDDNTAQNTHRATEILAGLLEMNHTDFHFTFETRINNFFDRKFVRAMIQLPFYRFLLGVESGYEKGLKMVGKGLQLGMVEDCARLIFQSGLSYAAKFSFILGLPWEKKGDILLTLDYILHLVSSYHINIQLCWHGIFPGSFIWNHKNTYGIDMKSEDYDSHMFQSKEIFFKVCPGLSEADVLEIQERLKIYVELAYLTGSQSKISQPLSL